MGSTDGAKKKALVLCSGGVDSTTLLALAVERYGAENVYALSIFYGQKHDRELEAAKQVARYYGVEQRFLDLAPIFAESDCSLLAASSAQIPHETYAAQLANESDALVSTYVPFRNGLFLSSAASIALSLDCSVVCYGAHADDWAGCAYPIARRSSSTRWLRLSSREQAVSFDWWLPSCSGRRRASLKKA